ncbi:hypothetical protein CRUP_027768, partial [Coryphaenoides rupestris]
CQQYRERAAVLENQPAGTSVLRVHATDADEGANGKVKYGLMHRDSATPAFRVHPDTASCAWPPTTTTFGTNAAISYSMSLEEPEYLRVHPLTGWVYVNQPISQRTYITREVVATDGGNRSTWVELTVAITNVKNLPPQWERESYGVVLPENTARDTPIVTIKATSQLGDPRVTYNLEDGLVPETNMPVRFYLSPNREDGSASILVSEPLDYEATPHFSLRVRAQNVAAVPLAAFATVYVNVTDVNDNVPFFTSSIYEASVPEGAEIGTLVLQVSSHDKDLGLNGEITYSLLSDSSGDHELFRMDPVLGAIYTEAVFDREARSSYPSGASSPEDGQGDRPEPGKNKQPNTEGQDRDPDRGPCLLLPSAPLHVS